MEVQFQGLIPPIPTPFDDQEELAIDRLRENLRLWNQCGFSAYLVLGSNGEFIHLSERERTAVLAAAREEIPPEMPMIVGCSLQSTREIIRFARQGARLGATAVLVNAPCYYPHTTAPARLQAHYRRVADVSPIPILLYNVPQFTGVSLPPDTVATLAEHPNIKGIKDSSGNVRALAHILGSVPEGFHVLTGSAPTFYPALALGAQGGILAVACVAWEACLELKRAVDSSNPKRAKELQFRLLPVATAVTSLFGIAGLKAALELRGFYGGIPRAPLTPVDGEVRTHIQQIFRASGLFPQLGLSGSTSPYP